MTTLLAQREAQSDFYTYLRPSYRQVLAALVPALLLAYAVLIWPLLFSRGYTADEFTQGPVTMPERSPLTSLVFPAVAALAVAVLLAERAKWPRLAPGALLALVGFWAVQCVSATWSILPSATISPLAVMTLTLLALGGAVMLTPSVEQLLKPLFWVMALTMLANLIDVLTTRAGPIGHEGIYIHKNELGGVAALGVIFSLYGLMLRPYWYRLVGLAGVFAWLFILYKSESKTSLGFALLAPMLGFCAVMLRRHLRVSLLVMVGIAVPALLFVLAGGIPGLTLSDISALVSGDRTFTGRVELWDFALGQLDQSPVLGFGYNSFWEGQIGALSPTLHGPIGFLQKAPNAHNGYIDILLQIGWVGLGLFALLFLAVVAWLDRLAREDLATGLVCVTLVIFIALHNMLESTWLATNSPNPTLFLLFALCAVARLPARQPLTLMRWTQ